MKPRTDASTFSVIQRSLDQKISLHQLEEASMQVPTIARADCRRIHNLLAGIFISRLSHPEALAFQRGLAAQGHQTDVVDDAQLPSLPPGMRSMRVSRIGNELHFRDFMDRLTLIPLDEILFISGGCIEHNRSKRQTVTTYVYGGRGGTTPVEESRIREFTERSARIDLFFSRAPHRFSLNAGESTRFFLQDQSIYLRKPETITWAFEQARSWAPANCRLNRDIHRTQPLANRSPIIAYEEEIRWHFYQLRQQAMNR